MKWVKKDDSKTIKEVVMRNITVPESEFEIDENKVYRIDRLDEVVSKIKESIDNNENIKIVGDYDADGVTSTSILYMALISLGAKVSYRLPKRISEGYGLSEKIVDEIDVINKPFYFFTIIKFLSISIRACIPFYKFIVCFLSY